MPNALKIFLWSLFSGIAGGYIGMRVLFWMAAHWFPRWPYADVFVLVFSLGVFVASAVTAGVLMGENAKS